MRYDVTTWKGKNQNRGSDVICLSLFHRRTAASQDNDDELTCVGLEVHCVNPPVFHSLTNNQLQLLPLLNTIVAQRGTNVNEILGEY